MHFRLIIRYRFRLLEDAYSRSVARLPLFFQQTKIVKIVLDRGYAQYNTWKMTAFCILHPRPQFFAVQTQPFISFRIFLSTLKTICRHNRV
jgi:hypothetical protein